MVPETDFFLLTLFLAPALFAQAVDSSNVQNRNPEAGSVPISQAALNRAGYVYDVAYDTLTHACEAAGSSRRILVISKTWTNVSSLNCPSTLAFSGGTLQLAPGAVVTVPAPATCGAMGFDVSKSGPGSVLFSSDPYNAGSNPRCFGAEGDGAHDDTLAIQAAIDAVAGPWNRATGYPATTFVALPAGVYNTTSELRVYKDGTPHRGSQGYEHFILRGAGKALTEIRYKGSNTTPAIRAIGGEMLFSDLSIADRNPAGWISGIDYDGDESIGRSTQSAITNILIDCLSHAGDGITIGRSLYQADSLSIDHPEIRACTSGRGVVSLNGNALSTVLVHAVIYYCWIGAMAGTSTNMSIFGGEFDSNDVNFEPWAGSVFLVEGVRSEKSKRTMFTGAGAYGQNFTLQNYQFSSNNMTRPPAKTTTMPGASRIELSVAGFTLGDSIVIAGAGLNGADLHTKITAMSSMTSVTVNAPAVSGVRDAQVTLDQTVNQNTLEENGGGPYVHIGNYFGPKSGATVSTANGPQVFIGNGWAMNITNPFGRPATSVGQVPGMVTLLGNYYNSTTGTLMPDFGGRTGAPR
jgi:hypothetical protein